MINHSGNIAPDGRKIPAIMATQHPDNAGKVKLFDNEFVTTADELEECYSMFAELKADEYMWDWEGKFVDEAVIEKLFRQYPDFFQKYPLGRDFFLTFRIPNADEEKTARLARAYLSLLTSDDFAKSSGFASPPVFEMILPMTTNTEQLLKIRRTFRQVAEFERKVFAHEMGDLSDINIIPLFETTEIIINSWKILEEYVDACEKEFGKKPTYMRPFIARSDPAMNAGLVPAECAMRAGISNYYYKFKAKTGIEVYPIIGTGSLPFRGGLNPAFLKERLRDLKGIRTVTTQSAFRYDYDADEVKKAYEILKNELPKSEPLHLSDEEINDVLDIDQVFGKFYRATVESIAPLINKVANDVPSRRERIQHIGLFGYSRGIGEVKLPRAIKFTGALYSIGLPPEFIGTGRGLKAMKEAGKLELIDKLYINLRADLLHAGKYFNPENLDMLIEEYPSLKDYKEDIRLIEEILEIPIGPVEPHHYIHRNLSSSAYWTMKQGNDLSDVITRSGLMRKSLG
ncbi:MAG: phosphoenolpyruvate carboxylase [Candidatus Peregrinibacteria bacterium]|nr:phosphoenolpyruvate carboxylase [Candidatus Peregrinibacteria bacterium]MDZ4244591.1 phosphoenolpyruvate carboxylase [Candidatus Gracilibacteria bacterium]